MNRKKHLRKGNTYTHSTFLSIHNRTTSLFLVIALLVIFNLVVNQKCFAQFNYKVNGLVISNDKPLSSSKVLLEKENGEAKEIITGANGAFVFTLEPNEEYTITLSKEGYTTVRLVYSTMVLSEEDERKIKEVSKPEIELFVMPTDAEGLEKINTLLNKPLLSFYFNADKKTIISDEIYEKTFESTTEKIKKITASALTKNEENIALEANYKSILTKADKAFDKKDYSTATSLYNDALKLKPTEEYPKSKISEINRMIADADSKAANSLAEKERIAKERLFAETKAKEDAERKAKETADEKDKAIALLAQKDRIAKENALLEAMTKVTTEAAEKEKIAKEKEMEGIRIKAQAEATENERLEKEKLAAEKKEKEKIEKEKALADVAEKSRLEKEAEELMLSERYKSIIVKADSILNIKEYALSKYTYNEALAIKQNEIYPKDKITEINAILQAIEKAQYTNELARNYPEGITEIIENEGNSKITKRILVQGNKGYLFLKKETGFGATYFFKDGVSITEQEFKKFTEIKQ